MRSTTLHRVTAETSIALALTLDGRGHTRIDTGIALLDRLLAILARHASWDLDLSAEGDLHVDLHHTTEDAGIALGQALAKALPTRAHLARYGATRLPAADALVEATVDLAGPPLYAATLAFPHTHAGEIDTEILEEFFYGFVRNARLTLHLQTRAGRQTLSIAEAAFAALGAALRQALMPEPAANRPPPVPPASNPA